MTADRAARRPHHRRWAVALPVVVVAATVVTSGCGAGTSAGTGSGATTSGSAAATTAAGGSALTGQAAGVTVADAWVKAADSGMTAGFAALTNLGPADAVVVGVTGPASASMELHQTVKDASGTTVMRAKPDGLRLPAGAAVKLSPGGDHVMFMGLAAPLKSGTATTFTLRFADGSTLPVTAEARTFSAADESYSHATGAASTGPNG